MKFSGDTTCVVLGSDDTKILLWKAKASEQLGVVGILPLLFVHLLFVLDLFVSLLEITHFQSPRKIDCHTCSYLFQKNTLKGILVLGMRNRGFNSLSYKFEVTKYYHIFMCLHSFLCSL